jgi:hypothetical protein
MICLVWVLESLKDKLTVIFTLLINKFCGFKSLNQNKKVSISCRNPILRYLLCVKLYEHDKMRYPSTVDTSIAIIQD